jgi:hypothetical protein
MFTALRKISHMLAELAQWNAENHNLVKFNVTPLALSFVEQNGPVFFCQRQLSGYNRANYQDVIETITGI